jgi:hypothetical protein
MLKTVPEHLRAPFEQDFPAPSDVGRQGAGYAAAGAGNGDDQGHGVGE